MRVCVSLCSEVMLEEVSISYFSSNNSGDKRSALTLLSILMFGKRYYTVMLFLVKFINIHKINYSFANKATEGFPKVSLAILSLVVNLPRNRWRSSFKNWTSWSRDAKNFILMLAKYKLRRPHVTIERLPEAILQLPCQNPADQSRFTLKTTCSLCWLRPPADTGAKILPQPPTVRASPALPADSAGSPLVAASTRVWHALYQDQWGGTPHIVALCCPS